jgi:ribosomal protein L37E
MNGGRNDLMYVGLDVHKNVCYGTVIDEKGKVAKQDRFTNDPEGVEAFIEGLTEAQVAMEAGYCWQPIYDALEDSEHDVRLAHPKEVKAIAKAKAKTDKIDSEILAYQNGVEVTKVKARNTSKTCSRCGELGHRNRSYFRCPHCGYEANSDRNASVNIARRLQESLSGRDQAGTPTTSSQTPGRGAPVNVLVRRHDLGAECQRHVNHPMSESPRPEGRGSFTSSLEKWIDFSTFQLANGDARAHTSSRQRKR